MQPDSPTYRPISTDGAPATLVGGGEGSASLLNLALSHAPLLVAADGGIHLAQAAGVTPAAVIGDFDSATPGSLAGTDIRHRPDQNLTDFQKCLAEVDAPLFLGVGFLGGRLDHQLAAFSAILGEPRPVVLVSHTELAFIAPERLALNLGEGTPLSLWPLRAATLTTTGLRYPLTQAAVAPDGLTSTSNHVEGGPVTITSDRRALLVTAPLGTLPVVIAALAQ
ncbi:MAG: thiamine diphosphokinase [Pseudomonadota bacterium]